MTAQSAIPLKWYVPFAQGDSSRVELPVTTTDATRASQTLGFPPLTMQPPESGGVPPQGEDFNGGMNQVARICWWILNGGGWPYDSTFATNSNINGYPNGAKLQSADLLGDWISMADNNQNNPDTGTGVTWVPGFQYGVTALTGLTGGTVTLTPAQAAKGGITLAGTLTSALTIVLPTWLKNWTITNNTTGAFVAIVKTAAGSGVTIPQTSQPTRVSGDGTSIVQAAENVAAATQPTNPTPMAQAAGVVGTVRNLKMLVTVASATATITADEIIAETALGATRYCLPSFNKTINLAATGAGGMDTGSAPVSGFVALYAIWNPATATAATLATVASATNVYSGANMPTGYTASALLAVWPTNASRQFIVGIQVDRRFWMGPAGALNTSSQSASPIALSLATIVPPAARTVTGDFNIGSSSITNFIASIQSLDSAAIGQTGIAGNSAAVSESLAAGFNELPIVNTQTIYWTAQVGAGTMSWQINITGYSI